MFKCGWGGLEWLCVVLWYVFVYIEFLVIDFVFDIVGCFGVEMGVGFVFDFFLVVVDEVMYFVLFDCKLVGLGSFYGVLLVYEGLWDVVYEIWYDVFVCFVVVLMVLEVWGFDVMLVMCDWVCVSGDEYGVCIFE